MERYKVIITGVLSASIFVSLSLLPVYKHFTKPNNKENSVDYDNKLSKPGKRAFASLKDLSITESIDNETTFKIKAE